MKKVLLFLLLLFGTFSCVNAYNPNGFMEIKLSPGRNVVSTPAHLQSLSFSGGTDLNFFILTGGKRTPIIISETSLLEPLQGYLVWNNSTGKVIMILNFRPYDGNIMDMLFQRNVQAGWNFLGITTTNNPFKSITNASGVVTLDFTHGGGEFASNHTNFVGTIDPSYPRFSSVWEYEIGEAYAVFLNNDGIYGGYNNPINSGNNSNDGGECSMSELLACFGSDNISSCMAHCGINSINMNSGENVYFVDWGGARNYAIYGETGVVVSSGKIWFRDPITMSFQIVSRSTGVSNMYFVVGDREYLGEKSIIGNDVKFSFVDIPISELGAIIQFKIDIEDDIDLLGKTITFSPTQFDKYILTDVKTIETNEDVDINSISGILSFNSIGIQKIDVSMVGYKGTTNYYINETARENVFNWQYSSSKGDVYLNSLYLTGTSFLDNNVTFYVYVLGEEIGRISQEDLSSGFIFSPIEVKDSSNCLSNCPRYYISIDAEVDAYTGHVYDDFFVFVGGVDEFGHILPVLSGDINNINIIERD